MWQEYVHGKQTLKQLSEQHGKSIRWIWEQLKDPAVSTELPKPCPTVVIADGFFFERGNGIMLFRSPSLRRNLYWFPIAYETIADYIKGIDHLEASGWTIQAVVCDGRQGVKQALSPRYPVQMCHFHQVAIVTRYLTRNPKLEAAIELRELVFTLKQTNEQTFSIKLEAWHTKWQEFLKERTTNPDTKRWFYTHRRVRSAYRSLKQNLPHLFIYQQYPHCNIPNTTNSLDGSIAHVRDKLRVHRGLKHSRRQSLTEELLP